MNPDAARRARLLAAAACWAAIAVANFNVSDTFRWYPDAIAWFALATAILALILAARPRTVFAFRLGGTVGIGTLLLRCVSIVEAYIMREDIDAIWISLAAIATTVMLAATYWRWWLTDVKRWHEAHKRELVVPGDPGSG